MFCRLTSILVSMSVHHVSHCPPGDQGGDGHLVTPVLAQQEHQQRQLRRVQQRPGLGIGFFSDTSTCYFQCLYIMKRLLLRKLSNKY